MIYLRNSEKISRTDFLFGNPSGSIYGVYLFQLYPALKGVAYLFAQLAVGTVDGGEGDGVRLHQILAFETFVSSGLL